MKKHRFFVYHKMLGWVRVRETFLPNYKGLKHFENSYLLSMLWRSYSFFFLW